MDEEEDCDKLLINLKYLCMQINCRGVSSDKTELTNMPDDVVCGLRSTLRDVSSDLTDEDMAV